jgi:hypothetical protein
MRKPTKTASELEAMIRVEMEAIATCAYRLGNHGRAGGGYLEAQHFEWQAES